MRNKDDIQRIYNILDYDKDGTLSIHDFEKLFNSYNGAKMDMDVWNDLLEEADVNGDGVVDFEEFQNAMGNILKKNLKKKQ